MLYTQAAQPTATEGGTPAPQRQWNRVGTPSALG